MKNSFPSLDGAILIDKASGPTSAEVLRQLKRAHKFSKIGHAGTLDPMATGLLIVLVGKATRLQSEFMNFPKTYEGKIKLGIATDTDDITGEVIKDASVDWDGLDQEEFGGLVEGLKSKFTGEIEQMPPQFSAKKVDGVRAYKKARKGEQVELKAKKVNITEFNLNLVDKKTLSYKLRCSSGTYVRSVARDLGEELGCFACAESIRRSATGELLVEEAFSLEELLEADMLEPFIVSMDKLTNFIAKVELDFKHCEELRNGDQSVLKTIESQAKTACIVEPGGEVCALIEQVEGVWKIRAVL